MSVAVPEKPARRRGAWFWRTLFWLVVIVLAVVLVLGTLIGAVPGLSSLAGTNRPRDLGVHPTRADYDRAVTAVGYKLNNLPAGLTALPGPGAGNAGAAATPVGPAAADQYRKVYSGQVAIDRDFTQAEVSALLGFNHVPWWLFQDPQLKVNKDGTLELATLLNLKGLPMDQLPATFRSSLPAVLPDQVPIYVKGRLDVTGPQSVKLSVERLDVGRLPVPANAASPENVQRANEWVNDRLRTIPGLKIESITYADGKAHFKGTWPQQFQRVKP